VPASLTEHTVLVVGRGSGIARAITLAIREAGGKVVNVKVIGPIFPAKHFARRRCH
jgi:NAD(P)-dependent dehydrogenase (short-subunit alcohol dehydrogenase family)